MKHTLNYMDRQRRINKQQKTDNILTLTCLLLALTSAVLLAILLFT